MAWLHPPLLSRPPPAGAPHPWSRSVAWRACVRTHTQARLVAPHRRCRRLGPSPFPACDTPHVPGAPSVPPQSADTRACGSPHQPGAAHVAASHSTASPPSTAEHEARSAEIQRLGSLASRLKAASTRAHKIAVLEDFGSSGDDPRLHQWLHLLARRPLPHSLEESAFLLRLLFVLGQHHVLPQETTTEETCLLRQVTTVLETLRSCEGYYDVLGGVAGYQLTALKLIHAHHGGRHEDASWELQSHDGAAVTEAVFHVPTGPDLVADPGFAAASIAAGLVATPVLGELYPLGGAGDRLGLRDEVTGEALPAAMLPYNGHTLLECLLRDVAAREYLYFRLCGAQVNTPVAIMTSAAKGNHSHVVALCEQHAWFGRGRDSFRLFQQPLVPVLKADAVGTWVLTAPGEPMLKPGGHGTIWKLAQDTGALDWLATRGVTSLLVRQISNPLAGTDGTLLALGGVGTTGNKAFGFVSCARASGAAEGVNVLMERTVATGDAVAYDYHVSAMEYTEFARLGIPDVSCEFTGASFPANTNVMFASLSAVQAALATGPAGALPGMLMNLSKPTEAWGEPAPVRAGRLECSMQNLVDCMPAQREQRRLEPPEWRDLSTFVLFTSRRRVTSSAKRRRSSDTDTRLAQTPEGSGLDYLRNAADMLGLGRTAVPAIATSEEYVRNGGRPGFLFRCHPALGPLWRVAAQKVRQCDIRPGAELELELSEADISGLTLDGSLRVTATQPLGALHDSVLAYSSAHCGRARLHNVTVVNAGVDWASPDVRRFWTGAVPRRETVTVTIHGDGEFDAEGVVLEGVHTFDVPSGHTLTLRPTRDGAQPKPGFTATLAPKPRPGQASWWWGHELQPGGHVALTVRHHGAVL